MTSVTRPLSSSNRPGRCASCDYDLRGSRRAGSGQCPECGQPLSTRAVAVAHERRFFRRLRHWGLISSALVILVFAAAGLILEADDLVPALPLGLMLVATIPVLLAAYLQRRMPED